MIIIKLIMSIFFLSLANFCLPHLIEKHDLLKKKQQNTNVKAKSLQGLAVDNEIPQGGQQGAPSYQAKNLQEEEVVEKQDTSGEQRPPHVSQRLGLVCTCKHSHSS